MASPIPSSCAFIAILALGIVGNQPAFAQVPPEFTGVWLFGGSYASNKCAKTDEGDSIYRTSRQGISGWEHGCKISKFKVHRREGEDPHEPPKLGAAELACSEAGAMWRSREIWHVLDVEGRKVLVRTQTEKTVDKDENDKTPFGPYRADPYVSVSFECK